MPTLFVLQDVVAGDPKLNMAFVANLFNHYHCLPPLKDAHSSGNSADHEGGHEGGHERHGELREETREERS